MSFFPKFLFPRQLIFFPHPILFSNSSISNYIYFTAYHAFIGTIKASMYGTYTNPCMLRTV